jgi:hypothetical protein
MDWKSIAGSIASFAPTIGAAIGGPVGSVAGMGIKALAGAFGIDSAADDVEVQVNTALKQMTPEQAMQIKNADKQFKLEMEKLGVDVFKLEIQDRSNARELYKATRNPTPMILTYLLVIIAGGIVYAVFNSQLTGIDKTLVGAVVGYVFGELKAATSFWFGSSKGSQDKTVHMGQKFS